MLFCLIFAGATPTIQNLEQATASFAWKTVGKAGGSDRRPILEEWREDFCHSCWKTKEKIKELVYNIPATYTFQHKKPSKLNKLSELQSSPDNSNPR